MVFLFKNFLKFFFRFRYSHVLLIFQNNNELRGGGGFITQVIDFQLGYWKIKLKFLDVFTDLRHSKNLPPPEPLRRLLKISNLQFRDANFSPDYEETAKLLIALYNQSFPANKVEQMITINFSFLEKLMSFIGPLKVGNETLTNENIFSFLSVAVSNIDLHDELSLKRRKAVLKSLIPKIIKKTLFCFWNYSKVYCLFLDSFKERNIQIFFLDALLQSKLEEKKLSYPFYSYNFKDYFSVIDNNFLGLKSNRYLRRSIFRKVIFEFDADRKSLGKAKINIQFQLHHLGIANYPLSGTYQSYLTFYLPFYAENVKLDTEVFDEDFYKDFKVIGLDNILSIGEKRSINLEYTLPADLFQDNQYSFTFLKQSGVYNENIFESIQFPMHFLCSSKDQSLQLQKI